MIKRSLLYCCTIICMMMSHTVSAQPQNEKKVYETIKSLQKIFETEEAKIDMEKPVSRDSSVITFLSNLTLHQDSAFSYDNYYEAYEKLLKKQTGISIGADALQNFNPTQADVEENILYERRAQLSLEWNLLKDGFFENQQKLKSIPAEKNYFNHLASNESKDDFGIKMNECIYWFNEKKKMLLNERERILNQQINYLEELYFAKKIDKERLLRSQTRIAEINGMKGIYNAYNQHIDSRFDSTLLYKDVPLYDLNYDYFFSVLNSQELADSMRSFLLENMASQHKWYNEIRLKPYLRYNFYDLLPTAPTSYRTFFSAGISANIPIPFTNKEQEAVDKYKTERQIYNLDTDLKNQRIELLNLAYEFRYQLKQYIIFHQKRILANEEIRKERVKAKMLDADFNPLHGLELIDDMLQIEIELLDLKQNLYIKLLRIHSKQQNVPLDTMIVALDLPNYFDFEDETQRGVYLWSKIFESQNPAFIHEYIVYNQFDEVYIALAADDKHTAAKNTLAKALTKSEIDVYPMIGQNKLLDSDDFTGDLLDILAQSKTWKVKGLHLDIEPHTREDWKANKEDLQEKYLAMISEARKLCDQKGWELSIDLPVNSDSNFVKKLYGKVDMIRFMCYENVKQDYLMRKLSPYKAFKNKSTIALRTEDFKTRDEMEAYAKLLFKETGISSFGFHDLNRLIELDKKTMMQNEKH